MKRYAKVAFTHLDRHVKKGEELDRDDELVQLRPDLFETKAAHDQANEPDVKTPAKDKEAS